MVDQAQVIVLAEHPLAKRKRARQFWGGMGAVLRFEDYRRLRDQARLPALAEPRPVRRSAFETRAPREG